MTKEDQYWIDFTRKKRSFTTKRVLLDSDLSEDAIWVSPPRGERGYAPGTDLSKKKRAKRKKPTKRRSLHTTLEDWDPSLKEGDLVWLKEKDIVWEIARLLPRYLSDSDMWNHPTLQERGFKVGQELSPQLYLHPICSLSFSTPLPSKAYIRFASEVERVDFEEIRVFVSSLSSILSEEE